MADPTSVVPFFETLLASVIASGILSAVLTTRHERSKENKRLQLEMIDKAMAMLHRHYVETEAIAIEVLHSAIGNDSPAAPPSSVDPYELHQAILKCAHHLNEEYQKYNQASVNIALSTALYKGRTERVQDQIEKNVMKDSDILKDMQDTMMTSMISRYHRLTGMGYRWAWKQFRQSYSDYSRKFWGLKKLP